MKKEVFIKISILILGMLSLLFILTSNIYIYTKFTLKAFDIKMWLGIITWLLFMLMVIIFTKLSASELKNNIQRIKLYLRNVSLLLMITILLVYKVGRGIITIYKMSNTAFNIVIYLLFALVFIFYMTTSIIINRKYLGKN